ncbi:MAG: hypothetical protein ACPGWR_02960 [Ardenticatenaceae bacterium]
MVVKSAAIHQHDEEVGKPKNGLDQSNNTRLSFPWQESIEGC